jgi:hypothetical protein
LAGVVEKPFKVFYKLFFADNYFVLTTLFFLFLAALATASFSFDNTKLRAVLLPI